MNSMKRTVKQKAMRPIAFVVLLMGLLFANSKSTCAQNVKPITIKEAIDLTLQNSHLLKAGKARTEQASAAVELAHEKRLPTLGVSASYLRLNNANVDLKTKSNNNSGGSSAPKLSQAMYGIVNASYSLFNGGRLKYGLESAKYLEQASLLDADNDQQGVILNAINAFVNLYKARAAVDIVKENLASSRHRDSTFSRLEINGLLARNDLLKAQLQTSDIELSLLDAENNRDLANVNMNLLLGLPESTQLVPDFNADSSSTSLKSIDEYVMMALQNRKDLQAIGVRNKAAIANIKVAKAENAPGISLTGGYIAAYVPHVITITNAINLGVGLQYNLASLWRTNTKLQQAKAQQNELLENQAQLGDAIKVEVYKTYQGYLLSVKKAEVYDHALEQSIENFRITKNKYDNSLVTTTDLLDADVAVLKAKLNVANSRADIFSTYNALLESAGLLTK